MKHHTRYFIGSLLLILASLFSPLTLAADRTFSQQELDQMLAPIALYPDPLLSQILMAATYPLEVVEAARWSNANPGIEGDAAVRSVANRHWDQSVKSLVAFPQMLQTLDQNIEWTERLGDAFLGQQAQVMDTIQTLRFRAREAGNLTSNTQIQVTQDEGQIEIAASYPDVVYVPYYDPSLVYGTWWWPDYQPMFWASWPGYNWYGGFAWGIGIGIGAEFFYGAWDWRHHHMYDRRFPDRDDGHLWQHDSGHRRGVPYPNNVLTQQYGRTAASPAPRSEFRGHDASGAHPNDAWQRTRTQVPQNSSPPQVQVGQPNAQPRNRPPENPGRGADGRGNSNVPGRAPPTAAPAQARGGTPHAEEHR